MESKEPKVNQLYDYVKKGGCISCLKENITGKACFLKDKIPNHGRKFNVHDKLAYYVNNPYFIPDMKRVLDIRPYMNFDPNVKIYYSMCNFLYNCKNCVENRVIQIPFKGKMLEVCYPADCSKKINVGIHANVSIQGENDVHIIPEIYEFQERIHENQHSTGYEKKMIQKPLFQKEKDDSWNGAMGAEDFPALLHIEKKAPEMANQLTFKEIANHLTEPISAPAPAPVPEQIAPIGPVFDASFYKNEIQSLHREIYKLKNEVKELTFQNHKYTFLNARMQEVDDFLFNMEKINTAVTTQFLKKYEPMLKEYENETQKWGW